MKFCIHILVNFVGIRVSENTQKLGEEESQAQTQSSIT